MDGLEGEWEGLKRLVLVLYRYGLSWNAMKKGHLLSASDDHVSDNIVVELYIPAGSF